MESKKTVLMNLFSGKQWRYSHRELNCGHGGEGDGGTNGENSVETYILPCVK